ncbi:DUF4231 domain-containing protein [Sciscionella sediminilitoris]|uniref:DUF4231 domain-containing protein n=1 Tax=Sciscionella sediminilitoris TaxID=1445613 RepID=UPI0009EA5A4B|nr:DUF4231 domain-containing protein [Sciscionella sp. SE31]
MPTPNEKQGRSGRSVQQRSIEEIQASHEQLLQLQHQIRELESDLAVAKRRRSLAVAAKISAPILIAALYVILWIPQISTKIVVSITIPAAVVSVGLLIAAVYLTAHPGGPKRTRASGRYQRESEADLALNVARVRDARKLKITQGTFDLRTRRLIYKDDSYADIEQLQTESNRYRRVNNVFQAVLIIGSATAAAGTAFSYSIAPLRWIAASISLIVTIATGFLGYYKYKERSFYLQQTADAIEHEWHSYEVGGGRYKRFGEAEEEDALAELVEELLRLKSEQKKRQQNLDQPAEVRDIEDS